jgi:acyl-CoA thioesterase-1
MFKKERKKVVVLGDSLALPRKEGDDIVKLEETWPYLLGLQPYLEVYNCSSRANNSEIILLDVYEHIELKQPHVVIIQIGIVDCAPRIFSLFEKKILRKLPAKVRNLIINRRKAKRNEITGKNPLTRVDVKPLKFKQNVDSLITQIKAKCEQLDSIILVPVIADFQAMEEKSAGFSSNANLYNAILEELAQRHGIHMMDTQQLVSEGSMVNFCSDHYHLSPWGNHKLFDSIYNIYFK